MVLRMLWNLGAGLAYRALERTPAVPGVGVRYPVVWRGRTGFLDCDVNLHLNNASYLYSMELARWHFCSRIGMLPLYVKKGMVFLVASQAIRYRRPIAPFQAYEIHSTIVYWDPEWTYFKQQFVCPSTGVVFAEGICRGAMKQGRHRVPMADVYRDSTGHDVHPMATEPPQLVDAFLGWDAASRESMEAAAPAAVSAARKPRGFLEKLIQSWNRP